MTGPTYITIEVGGNRYRVEVENLKIEYVCDQPDEIVLANMIILPPTRVNGIIITGDLPQ